MTSGLAFLLFVAGLTHLIQPTAFMPAMPPLFPAPEVAIVLTGFLEILSALALFYRPWRRLVALWLAVYFASLIPVHLYVAWNDIPMFGMGHPAFLWVRTLLQAPLVYWAWHIAQRAEPWRFGWRGHVLALAAVYNLCFGLWAVFFPSQAFAAVLLPQPNYPELWQCIGMIVGVYGVGYAIASSDPDRHWPIVLVGLLGKIFGPIGFCYALWRGSLPLSFGAILVTNDLLWWVPFGAILRSQKMPKAG